jgi:hypothetical protein
MFKLIRIRSLITVNSNILNIYGGGSLRLTRPVSENFFHSLKTELVHHQTYQTREEAKQTVFEYRQSVHLTEACAIANYQQQTDFPIIARLLADDAPQFKLLTLFLCLCWIHEARHYKNSNPSCLDTSKL